MKRLLTILCGLMVAVQVMAVGDTFYLQAGMPANSDPMNTNLWWNAPSGGDTMATLGAEFAGNFFDPQAFQLRAPNTAGSRTFPGTFVFSASFTAGLYELYCGTWSVNGMVVSNGVSHKWRLRRNPNNLNVDSLDLQGSGTIGFQSYTTFLGLNLSASTLTGSGTIEFGSTGNGTDDQAVWSPSAVSTSFVGRIKLVRGNKLALGATACQLVNATLEIVNNYSNTVDLAVGISPQFGAVDFGGSVLSDNGTYTASDLNTYFGTTRFTGDGNLLIGAGSVVYEDDYFMQADNNTATNNILNQLVWWDAPSGGTQMGTNETFAGKRFNVNGFRSYTPNPEGGFPATNSFAGTLVNKTFNESKPMELLTPVFSFGGLDVSDVWLWRIRVAGLFAGPRDVTVTNLMLDSAGVLEFRCESTTVGTNLHLTVENLSGDGTLRFGRFTTVDYVAQWNLNINDASSDFSGTVYAYRGELVLANSFALTNASFLVDTSPDATVVLDGDVAFGSLVYGATVLSNGTYTASDLNTVLVTTVFSGSGSITFGPVSPATYYQIWLSGYPALGSDTNFLDDAEPDSLANLVEYAIGGDPTSDTEAALFGSGTLVAGGTNWLYFAYPRRTDAAARGLSYTVVSGSDLVVGLSDGTTEYGASAAVGGFESVTNVISIDAGDTGFMTLKVDYTE